MRTAEQERTTRTTEPEEQERATGTPIKGDEAWYDEMVAAARVVYFWHGGEQHLQIEQKMWELGWKEFHKNLLYPTTSVDGTVRREGWPHKYGWRDQVMPVRQRRKKSTMQMPHGFPKWLKKVFPEWEWGWEYQLYLFEKLALVSSGECRRLMIFMPPRHGKSETVTFRYTAWRLLCEPGLNVIVGSYNQRLANKASRRIQRIVDEGRLTAETERREEEFKQDVQDKHDGVARAVESEDAAAGSTDTKRKQKTPKGVTLARSVAEWETGGGGTVRAVGVGAGIAGFGAGLVVIDDPVRNRADAESETYRDKVWDWFNDDIYTRLEPNAAIILIQTRWHEDDLAGRLLKEMEDEGGEKWEVVKLPAIAEDEVQSSSFSLSPASEGEKIQNGQAKACTLNADPLGRKPGEALCPERYDVKALEQRRRKLGSYSFAALYQQEPVPSKGVKFKREWFRKIVDEAPKGLRWKRGYDLAVSLKTSADYTASFRCAYDKDNNLYISGGYRSRIEYPEQRRYIIERLRAERDTEHGVEAALHGKALIQDLRSDPRNRAFAFKEIKVAADKLTRALAWLNLAEAGKLFLVRGAWIDEFVDEVSKFPHGKHDDQIDAVSVAVSMLAKKENRAVGMLIT